MRRLPRVPLPGRRGLLALAGLAIAAGTAFQAPRILHAVAGLEVFRVARVEIEGTRYLTHAEATSVAAVPPGTSVWDDPHPWEARVLAHPLVGSVRTQRRLLATLVLVIEEREPVGLAAGPTLEPVDSEGRVLPLDPAEHGLDLPLLFADAGAPGALRVLAREAARLGRIDPSFLARVSELAADEHGDLMARWGDPVVTFRYRPSAPARRLREGTVVLADARERAAGRAPANVDLRFADQVVVGTP